jgi:hypothetical protein
VLIFSHLIHADWSTSETKRWMTIAERRQGCWHVSAPQRAPAPLELLNCHLFRAGKVLAGSDFPIGLPKAFGCKTGVKNFPEALIQFGSGEWCEFFQVANAPAEISLKRPFYPRTSTGKPTRAHLIAGLGVNNFDDLLRDCERKTASRANACSLFWTLGPQQVGRAAIHGWQSVIRPARERGAGLWPFDGRLADLAAGHNCVLCETYPREAYGHLGVQFLSQQSKRVQADRRMAASMIPLWGRAHRVIFHQDAEAAILDGFGRASSGEDAFDSLLGLLGMIEVFEGRRPEGATDRMDRVWEGWILGQI